MALLPLEAFAHVFEPLQGRRVGWVRPLGNVGDALIEMATIQLFARFGISWTLFDPGQRVEDVDEIVYGGGGNMGSLYEPNLQLREKCLRSGRPVTIFPQSFTSPERRPYKRVYVRERISLRLTSYGILAPDLPLGLEYTAKTKPAQRRGIFLRRDLERAGRKPWFAQDPARLCNTPQEYLELAARYEHVITDRLHFAISSLIVGRRTTLLPNSYHKNVSMYETWLKGLGCEFARSVRHVTPQRVAC